MNIKEALEVLFAWAETADSYDRIGVIKAIMQSAGITEIHHTRVMISNLRKNPQNRKRPWTGPTIEEKKKLIKISEDRNYKEDTTTGPTELLVPRSSVPRSRSPWWEQYRDLVVGYDAEHVHLIGIDGSARIRAGIVAVVDGSYRTIVNYKIYHKPGTFLDGPINFKVSGIGKYDLLNGESLPTVKQELHNLFLERLIIVCGGTQDFTCIALESRSYEVFDLQSFYRKQHNDGSGSYGMSLRDIYFMEFNEDMQGTNPHDPVIDAKATVCCFIEGYCKRNKSGDCQYFEFFDAVSLKRKDVEKLAFCNTDKKFKSKVNDKCKCRSCIKLFYGT